LLETNGLAHVLFQFLLINLKSHVAAHVGQVAAHVGAAHEVEEVGAKFSPTLEVEEDFDHLIRKGVPPLPK
jgi:hypothetical protein